MHYARRINKVYCLSVKMNKAYFLAEKPYRMKYKLDKAQFNKEVEKILKEFKENKTKGQK
jgi:hypothetical protein